MNSFRKFCPNCENFPTLCINRTQINIKCKCGYAQVISIKDYLNQLKKCNSLHCITNPKFVKITDKINAGYTHLLTYFKEINDNLLTQMIKQLNDLESSYEQSIKENTDVLSLIQKLIDNYNGSKMMERNIILNSNIQIYKCKNDNSLDNVINYYKTYSIINANFIDFVRDEVDCISSNNPKISKKHTKTLSNTVFTRSTSNLLQFTGRNIFIDQKKKTNKIEDKNVNYAQFSNRYLNTIENSTTPMNKPKPTKYFTNNSFYSTE